jgi:hypothetical protein
VIVYNMEDSHLVGALKALYGLKNCFKDIYRVNEY